ncbi:MAG: hypothetical protein BWK76_07430 [Desulfobulbaceae bacterium A2]|nr:MAG: hypothetical protein BWK76_07430 [Desulfobulbaceae bacterium A2]
MTDTLIRLLRRYISQPQVWGMAAGEPLPPVSISGEPPDLLAQQTDDYALGLYLYHIQEDPHCKNFPEPSGSSPPVRFQEMALQLYYLLTAHGGKLRETHPFQREQRLMGMAIKAFHDYPVLDCSTTIGTEGDRFIFPDTLRHGEDEFRLVLHPATLEEINKVWTAANVPVRLSAVYQVSVILLAAEEAVTSPVPVLAPCIDAGRLQSVWIQATASDCRFTLPGEIRARTASHSPALVAVGESFRILGNGLDESLNRVLLTRPDWLDPPALDVTHWVSARQPETHLELTVSSPVAGRAIPPGLYQVYVQRDNTLSNFSPLAIVPQISPATAPTPGVSPDGGPIATLFRINGGPFSGTEITTVRVYLGGVLLRQSLAPPAPGEFLVVTEQQLEVRVPPTLAPGNYAVRVAVNGITTLPTRWFAVTP